MLLKSPDRSPEIEAAVVSNVVPLHPRVMPRHTALLARWLAAGQRMGLCNAQAFYPGKSERDQRDYVLVWVRENADPAYMVHPEGTAWVVTDLVRQMVLMRLASFGAALNYIRPVLPLEAAA
jgi:hypothetical protein